MKIKYLTLFLLVFALLLSACGGEAAPESQSPAPEDTAVEVEAEPTEAVYPEPEADTAEQAEMVAYPEPEMDTAGQAAMTEAYPEPETEADANAGVSDAGMNGIVFKIVPAESSLSYEVGETFINDNNRFAVAIGLTTEIAGEITIDPENPQNSSVGTITADISKFKSDSSRRDSKIQNDFLESAKYPVVTFVPTEVIGFPENPQPGESYTFQIVGDTTIRETTLPLTFDVTLTVTAEMITGEASTTFLMSNFGFGPITIGGILNTEDEVKINFVFVARP